MRETPQGAIKGTGQPSPLRYVPATLVSALSLAVLLVLPSASQWARHKFYGTFLKGKGAPAPTQSTLLVRFDGADGDGESLDHLVQTLLAMGPAALAVDLQGLPALPPADSGTVLPQGPLVLGLGFRSMRPYTITESSLQENPPLLTRSLYPLLDEPGTGLRLRVGEDLDTSGLRPAGQNPGSPGLWPTASAGFTRPLPGRDAYAAPAFARLGRGVIASLGVEAARRALRVPADKVGYVEGVGALFDSEHLLPVDAAGEMLLRFYAPEGIPSILGSRVLEGQVADAEVQDKVVFLVPAASAQPSVATVSGGKTAGELWATAAANLLDRQTLAAPSWGNVLSVAMGIVFAAMVVFSLAADLGGLSTFLLACLLAVLYPLISYWFFLKSSWWLPPELPSLMVISMYLPFGITRLLMPKARRSPAPSVMPPPTPPPRAMPQPRVAGVPDPGPIPPAPRMPTESLVPAPAPDNRRPVARERAPIPPVAPAQSVVPEPGPSYSAAAARLAPAASPAPPAPAPQPVPAAAQPAPARPGEDIERDAKGGLVRVGKYRIVRKMGFGSAGDVFEGLDTHMGRKVAIKTITKDAASHFDRAVERFSLEAKAAGSLNHPHINIIYDYGNIQNVSYMVLEFLDGITLSQWMRNNPVPPQPTVVSHWLQQICSAMDYAHSHKVVHRDLKPSNLMIVNGGATIKLLDFGIAKVESVELTQTGMTVGTPSYMSPEQLTGARVGPASDQYGLAVVVYQLFTYKLPYLGTKIPELCNRILKNDLIPITEANPALGGPFWEALRKALSKNPEDRYPNCMAMYQALEAAFPAIHAAAPA